VLSFRDTPQPIFFEIDIVEFFWSESRTSTIGAGIVCSPAVPPSLDMAPLARLARKIDHSVFSRSKLEIVLRGSPRIAPLQHLDMLPPRRRGNGQRVACENRRRSAISHRTACLVSVSAPTSSAQ
jgi:hypothetical protein